MANLIPIVEKDALSPELQAQFESLHRLLSQQNQDTKHNVTPEEIEDEILYRQGTVTIDGTVQCSARQLAISTAISTQTEIERLLRGISELEHMLENDDDEDDRHRLSNTMGVNNNQNIASQVNIYNVIDNGQDQYHRGKQTNMTTIQTIDEE